MAITFGLNTEKEDKILYALGKLMVSAFYSNFNFGYIKFGINQNQQIKLFDTDGRLNQSYISEFFSKYGDIRDKEIVFKFPNENIISNLNELPIMKILSLYEDLRLSSLDKFWEYDERISYWVLNKLKSVLMMSFT